MLFYRTILVLGLCMMAVGIAMADATVEERQTAVKLYRGSSIIAASDPKSSVYVPNFTPAACEILREQRWKADGLTRTTGRATYNCQVEERAIVRFHPAPVLTCGDRPGPDEQQRLPCPDGTVGTWLQDRIWTLQPYPTCWTQGEWTPSSPPAGMCAPIQPPLVAPANLRTTTVSATLVRVAWDAVIGAQSYELQSCRGITCENLTPLACVPGRSYDHTLPLNATARYKVAASRATDCSSPGAQTGYVVGTTVQPEPQVCTPLPLRPQNCPTGYSGTWSQQAILGPAPDCEILRWEPIAWPPDACTPDTQPPPDRPLFIDQFEYDVSRSATGTRADQLFAGSGWPAMKANNSSMARGSGWIYTIHDSTRGSRVLVLESHPQPIAGFPDAQTDYYLQLGREGSTVEVLPANVWIQFWTYATPDSRFSTRDKTIYPCNSHYACSWGPNLGWLFMWGSGGFNVAGDGSSRRFIALEAQNADRDTRVRDGNEAKLFQNVSATPLHGGRWYQVRLHMDTSGTQGTFEAWIKERGQASFTKVSDWRGGQTANFSWPIPADQRRGHTMFRMPTTVNNYSNTVYIDDFVIGRSLSELPAN